MSQIDDDTFEYESSGDFPISQCISGFGRNAIDDIVERLHDVAAQERDAADAIKAVEFHISELVRWARHHNGERQRAEAELAAVTAERDRLREALQSFCGDPDTPCCCDDWMVTKPGDKCVYCNGRAALQDQPKSAPESAG